MPWFNVELEEELSKKFKSKVIQIHGQLRGNANKAFIEAITDWVKKDAEE